MGRADALWLNGHFATMAVAGAPYGAIRDGALAAEGGRISWIGPRADLPPGLKAEREIDLGGRWVTPGLIDCHTHMVFAGDRAEEFERRLKGETYEDIARAGGGIASTVRQTRGAGQPALVDAALPRLDALIAEGVTTVEIKSGYGLERETELKQLRVARQLAEVRDIGVRTTLLAAHATPAEFAGRSDAYIDLVCGDIIPAAAKAGLADAVDGFCERIAFNAEQMRRVFQAARANGLRVKLHAEQLSQSGGSKLAAEFGALSADHLEHAVDDDAAALAKAGTVAVLLPGAFYFLRERQAPPIDSFRRHGVPMAVATDCNPGTSPLTSILAAMNMACTLFRLTPEEALAGATRAAARALGMAKESGTLEAGKACDLAVWNILRPAELCYRLGFNPLHARVRGGQ
jgi:imidazolonepropionase